MLQSGHILVADDHPLYRDALSRAIRSCFPGVEVVEVGSFQGLQDHLTERADVDLVVLDLKMPDTHGFSALSFLRNEFPDIPVVVVSAAEQAQVISRAMNLGAAAFVPKSAANELLRSALEAVMRGEVWMPPGVEFADEETELHRADRLLGSLTQQQLRVLNLLSQGLLNKQIAFELGVAEATVKSHVTAIMRKLGVHNRTQAVLLARSLDVDPENNLN